MKIPQMKGKELEELALKLGIIRKKIWWFIREDDISLRNRIEYRVQQICNKELSVLGVRLG